MPYPPDQGPLPGVDANDALERQHKARFTDTVPVDRLYPREEKDGDKGIDCTLELLIDGNATNLRTAVQRKAVATAASNTDGSCSLSVKVSNLRYLLNGPCPLYAFWIADRDEQFFAWARDEAARLTTSHAGWEDQGTVTIRFTRRLDAEGWKEIAERTRREGLVRRRVSDEISFAATGEPVTVRISEATAAVVTANDVYRHLSEFGLALVASGVDIESMAQLLDRSKLAEARISLVLGYAAYARGDYFSARSQFKPAILHRSDLSAADGHLLDVLVNECDFACGRLTEEVYQAQRQAIEQRAPEHLARQLRLERLRDEHLAERDTARRESLGCQVRQVADQLLSDPATSDPMRVQVELVRLLADIDRAMTDLVERVALDSARAGMGFGLPADIAAVYQQLFGALTAVHQTADRLVSRARELEHPLLLANAITTCWFLRRADLCMSRLMIRGSGRTVQQSAGLVEQAVRELDAAVSLYRRGRNTSGEGRALLERADWLALAGRVAEMTDTAEQARAVADAGGDAELSARAAQTGAGRGAYAEVMDRVANPPDLDRHLAARTDKELRAIAESNLVAAGVPQDRLQVVVREWHAQRHIARQKLTWCQHLELLQGKRHERHPSTWFATDPGRIGYCLLHKCRGRLETTDAEVAVAAFKGCFCETCPDRSPKGNNEVPAG